MYQAYIRFKRILEVLFQWENINTFNHISSALCIVTEFNPTQSKYFPTLHRNVSNAQRHTAHLPAPVPGSHPADQLPCVKPWYTPVAHAQQIYSQKL